MTITLTGDQGYTQFKPSALAQDVDATAAIFHISQQTPSFLYPIDIRNSAGRTFTGGKWVGDDIDLTTDWQIEYAQGNSAAFRIENNQNFTFRGGHFDTIWDGFRPAGTSCNGWLVEGVLAENVRDDFVENDGCNSGTIRDCLVDGGYVSCISTTNGTSTTRATRTVTIEDSLFGAKTFLVEGEVGEHGSPFKVEKTSINVNPRFVVNRCVFAIDKPDHNMSEPGGRLSTAFAGMEGTGNYWLNRSDTPISTAYAAMIPAGFTLLQGQPARDMWAAKRSAWRVAHGYDAPEEPDMLELIAALQAAVDALTAELMAQEAAIAANTAAIAALQPVDLTAISAELARLDGRLDAISGAAGD